MSAGGGAQRGAGPRAEARQLDRGQRSDLWLENSPGVDMRILIVTQIFLPEMGALCYPEFVLKEEEGVAAD